MRGSRRHASAASRAGLTLLEATIAMTLVCMVAASAVVVARGGYGAFDNTTRNNDLETRVRRALDRAAFELTTTIRDGLDPVLEGDLAVDGLQFTKAAGFAMGAIVPSAPHALFREADPGDPDDGIDNDGDGIVDEGRLVLVRNVGSVNERRVVLCNDVAELYPGETANGVDDNGNDIRDEAGFDVHIVDGLLVLRLCLQAATDQGGVVERMLETSVRLRN